jgi:hypothetical protein
MSQRYQEEYQKERLLQQDVLDLLKKYGPMDWHTLSMLFSQSVLLALCDQKLIEVDKDIMVTITASGLRRT